MSSRRNQTGCSVRFAIAGLLIVIAVVALFFIYQQYQTQQTQQDQQAQQSTQVQTAPATEPSIALLGTAAATANATGNAAAGTTPKPFTLRIVADKAQLLTEVTELYFAKNDDWDLTHLGQLAGHLQGTPNIGEGGNYVLAGHVEMKDGTPGPFAYVGALKAGDFISIFDDKPGTPLVMQYSVMTVGTVKPTDFNVIRNHGYEELTLVTCTDWDQKTRSYNSRVVVHALPIKNAQRAIPK